MLHMHVYIRIYGYTSMLYVKKHRYSLMPYTLPLLNMYGMTKNALFPLYILYSQFKVMISLKFRKKIKVYFPAFHTSKHNRNYDFFFC